MLRHHIILAILWILYCVLHSVLASPGVKRAIQGMTGNVFRYYRLFYTIFAAAGLVALLDFQFSIRSEKLFRPTTFSVLAGALLALAGLSLMLVCIRKYFISLSGLKSLYEEAPAAELMITGIHRYMRHPLYSGTFLAIWGGWVLLPSVSLLIADVVITLYTLLAIRLEEEKLVAEFGDRYRLYQQNVPKLIPRF